jgi:hypothetical protein
MKSLKKTLAATFGFLFTYFGVFAIINLLVTLMFPVTWYDVVTCPQWLVSYFFIGLAPAIAVADDLVNHFEYS